MPAMPVQKTELIGEDMHVCLDILVYAVLLDKTVCIQARLVLFECFNLLKHNTLLGLA